VARWYYSDNRRMAEVEAIVIENNVTNYVMSLVKVKDKNISFDDLMGQA
jgi:trigger factor